MLARVAESLYWIGRNVERCEHCSRYLKVQYYSTLDAPMTMNKDFIYRSILFMSGSNFSTDAPVTEKEVWQKVIFDPYNPSSILSIAKNARENSRSIRNNISTELWESINKWFLYCKSLDNKNFNPSDVFHFTDHLNAHLALIKSNISNTLIHNEIWSFICLGAYVERASQVLRIMRSKISDSMILGDNGANIPLMQYQWTTLLKTMEAFDIHKNLYKGIINKESVFELVLSNPLFPRSLVYTGGKIYKHISYISVHPIGYSEVLSRFNNALVSFSSFKDFSDYDKVNTFIDEAYSTITNLHFEVEKLYFR